MPLRDGDQIGPYMILGPLGKGGMGEVYRARDTRLDREVALKLLAEAAAQDADHLARFERETRAVASLNHPNIMAIHDTGSHRGVPYAVTELLEGETLAERLHSGPIAPKKSVDIACQIADGLAAAHARGVIHRDIKPENIFVTHEGRAKILDFGIARMERPTQPFGGRTGARTRGTSAKFVVGTAGYMSPEQVRGKPIDSRTDVFSLGATFFEMLTGKQAFARESAVETFGAVLKDDPAKNPEAEKIPPEIRRFVYRCLEKDAADRYQSARDLLLDLRAFQAEGVQESAKRAQFRSEPPWKHRRTRMALRAAGAVVIFGLGILLGARWLRRERAAAHSPAHPLTRLQLHLSPPLSPTALERAAFALSPDGTRLVFSGDSGRGTRLYLRAMDSLEAAGLPGTEGADGPFFSPDGQWVGFFVGSELKKISLAGGPPVIIGPVPPVTRGAAWLRDDSIVYSPSNTSGLYLSKGGAEPRRLTKPDYDRGERAHRWPELLPDGNTILFTVVTDGGPDRSLIAVQRLDTGERKVLLSGGTNPRYAPTGHLLFARGGAIHAAPFDLERLVVTGKEVPVLPNVRVESTGVAQFAFSRAGTVVFAPGESPAATRHQLLWIGRNGESWALAPAGDFFGPRFSPDGRRVAFSRGDSAQDVWIYDLQRRTSSRLTPEESEEFDPVWSSDGRRVAYASERREEPPQVIARTADGSGQEELLWKADTARFPQAWSPDGRVLACIGFDREGLWDIWMLSLEDRKATPFLKTPFVEAEPDFSPDGRWVAHTSNESGRFEVYVRPYPGPGGKIAISDGGGREPVWSRNGRELFYRNGGQLLAVPVQTGDSLTPGKPRVVFDRANLYRTPSMELRSYDVSPDGRGFVALQIREQSGPPHLQLVTEWFSELERRAPQR